MQGVPAEHAELFADFVAIPARVREAIRGLTGGGLNARDSEGWSARDLLVHLADSELVLAVNVRQVVATDSPELVAMDAQRWQRRLGYLWQSPEAALAILETVRYSTAEVLRNRDRASWLRSGNGPEGAVTVRELIEAAVAQGSDCVTRLTALRESPAR